MLRTLITRRGATLAAAFVLLIAAAPLHAQAGVAPHASTLPAASPANLDSLLERASRGRIHGSADARVTIVEISDFQCPFCRQFFESTYRQLDSAYVRTGKVKLVFYAFPLPGHREAYPAAKAAMCAGVQGKFWGMHDRLFATQREWSGQDLVAPRFATYAQALGVDMAAYRDCVDNDRVAPVILNDAMQASGAGVNGTPTFIINGSKALNGAVPFEELKREIDAALAAPPAAAPPPPAAGTPAPPRP